MADEIRSGNRWATSNYKMWPNLFEWRYNMHKEEFRKLSIWITVCGITIVINTTIWNGNCYFIPGIIKKWKWIVEQLKDVHHQLINSILETNEIGWKNSQFKMEENQYHWMDSADFWYFTEIQFWMTQTAPQEHSSRNIQQPRL